MAIRNAFHRAGVVIIDANITHLIAATVLFVEGTEQVKGFAVTFWLGAVLSIWATMFVARVIFEIAERRQWLTQVKMMHVIGHTKIDFMGWFPACATFSVLITVLGLAVAVYRGKGLFDIDFTGGVSVQALFNEPQDIGEVRKTVGASCPTWRSATCEMENETARASGSSSTPRKPTRRQGRTKASRPSLKQDLRRQAGAPTR